MMHVVAAKAVALKEAATAEYQKYTKDVLANAQALTQGLIDQGMRAVTGGTDTHLALIDLRGIDVTGKDAEARCSDSGIVLNKNSIPYDPQPAAVTSGIRVGTPSVTTQGMGIAEMQKIAELIGRAVRTDSASDHAAIKQEVDALTTAFPAYPRG